MIQNLQDELYHLGNKQAEGVKLRANIKWEPEDKKYSKTFFEVLERQNMLNLLRLLLLNLLAKFLTKRKYLMNNFTFVRLKDL